MKDEITLAMLSEGQRVDGIFLLAGKKLLTTKTGKPFGALKLLDASGEVEAKLWDDAEDILEELRPGDPVRVHGRVDSYMGRKQVVLDAIAKETEADPARFLPKSPHKVDDLWDCVAQAQGKVKHQKLRKLLKLFFEDPSFRAQFQRSPAAKGAHHAYVHGLLEHTASIAGLALKVADHYQELDRDILVAGALLHDIGKTKEFSLGPPINYTDEGRLEGHLVIGVRMLDDKIRKIKDFPQALATQLRHLILSHHGEYLFQSPKKPKTLEAMVLHMIDDLDAKTAMIQQAIKEAGDRGSSWTGFNRLLERYLYAGPSPGEVIEEGAVKSAAPKEPEEPTQAPALRLFD